MFRLAAGSVPRGLVAWPCPVLTHSGNRGAEAISNFHTVVINLGILENFGKFWIFSGRFGPRGGRKRILREK